MLFSAPEYAGALPGSFKNVLDWAVGDDQRAGVTAPREEVHARDVELRREAAQRLHEFGLAGFLRLEHRQPQLQTLRLDRRSVSPLPPPGGTVRLGDDGLDLVVLLSDNPQARHGERRGAHKNDFHFSPGFPRNRPAGERPSGRGAGARGRY